MNNEAHKLAEQIARRSATIANAQTRTIPLEVPAEIRHIGDGRTFMEALTSAAFYQGIETAERELRERFAALYGDPSRIGARSEVATAALAIVESLIRPEQDAPQYAPLRVLPGGAS
jgi:hypothetical protein